MHDEKGDGSKMLMQEKVKLNGITLKVLWIVWGPIVVGGRTEQFTSVKKGGCKSLQSVKGKVVWKIEKVKILYRVQGKTGQACTLKSKGCQRYVFTKDLLITGWKIQNISFLCMYK